MMLAPHGWPLALATVLLAGLIDVLFGEPPARLHPVVWMGTLIGVLSARRPHGSPRREFAWGVLIVAVLVGVCVAAGLVLVLLLAWLPWFLALPLGAVVLKTTFSLRGLVAAGDDVRRALAADLNKARDDLAALVSRDRNLDPPGIVSATVESLAENLVDSVVSPLLFFALLGLPGALVYRAVNTMDAMIGYRGEYEYVGKAAARCDDVLNFVPARLTGLLLVALAGLQGAARPAWETLRRNRRRSSSPNKLWTIAPMAGALGVQLEKAGVYAVGQPRRPLAPGIITEAVRLVWAGGAVTLVTTAAVAALVAGMVWA
jgi:adenosylcobinamide-phosphate synthase